MSGPGYTAPTGLPDYPPHTAVDVPPVADDAVVPSVQDVGLDFTDSQFNPHSASGTMSGSAAPADAPLLNEAQGSVPDEPDKAPGKAGILSWKRFQKYFDVETKDVFSRMGSACLGPFKSSFFDTVEDNADLYGPFWIATTLIFLTAVASNMLSYYNHVKDNDTDKEWISDYKKMVNAAILFYCYIFGVGFCLWTFLRCFKAGVHLSHVWCIYGYSFTIFLPISIVLVIPIVWVQCLIVAVATIYSGSFLLLNFKQAIYHAAPTRAVVALAVMGVLHIGVGIVVGVLYMF